MGAGAGPKPDAPLPPRAPGGPPESSEVGGVTNKTLPSGWGIPTRVCSVNSGSGRGPGSGGCCSNDRFSSGKNKPSYDSLHVPSQTIDHTKSYMYRNCMKLGRLYLGRSL